MLASKVRPHVDITAHPFARSVLAMPSAHLRVSVRVGVCMCVRMSVFVHARVHLRASACTCALV